MLRVEVKNLGPIAEGAIQLRPLTIFIGRNSSGKSYMAMLIYCLAKAFRQTFPTAYFSQWFPRDPFSAFMTEVFNQDEAFRSMWDKWIIEYVRLAERQEIIINSMPQPVIDFLAGVRDGKGDNTESHPIDPKQVAKVVGSLDTLTLPEGVSAKDLETAITRLSSEHPGKRKSDCLLQ